MKTTLLALLLVCAAFAGRAGTVGDDFNDNIKNTSKWGPDELIGNGVLKEIEYCYDTLKVDAIGIYTNDNKGRWPGDKYFEPMWQELNRRNGICYMHPLAPTCCSNLRYGPAAAMLEFDFDITRAVASIVVNGVSIPQSRIDAMNKELTAQGQPDTPERQQAVREELIIREILASSGASVHYLDHELQRLQRDIHMICAHTVFDVDLVAEGVGRAIVASHEVPEPEADFTRPG